MEMFDTIAVSESGSWMHLSNSSTGQKAYLNGEDGKPDQSKPCRIKLLGPDSATYKRKASDRAARQLKSRGNKMDFTKMAHNQIMGLITDGEKTQIEDAADATVGWENLPLPAGKGPEFSHDLAVWLYTGYPDILRQVDDYRKEVSNFFG